MRARFGKLSLYSKRFRKLVLAMLREIFDEAAYERYLIRQGQGASVGTYAAFRRCYESSISRKQRCC